MESNRASLVLTLLMLAAAAAAAAAELSWSASLGCIPRAHAAIPGDARGFYVVGEAEGPHGPVACAERWAVGASSPVWSFRFSESDLSAASASAGSGFASLAVVEGTGDVVAAGHAAPSSRLMCSDGIVVRLAAADGRALWESRRPFRSSQHSACGSGSSVAGALLGRVAVLDTAHSGGASWAAWLDETTGTEVSRARAKGTHRSASGAISDFGNNGENSAILSLGLSSAGGDVAMIGSGRRGWAVGHALQAMAVPALGGSAARAGGCALVACDRSEDCGAALLSCVDGRAVWSNASARASLVADGLLGGRAAVLVGSVDREVRVAAVDGATGKELWSSAAEGDAAEGLALGESGDAVYVAASSSRSMGSVVSRMDARTGARQWSVVARGADCSSGVVVLASSEVLCFGIDGVFAIRQD